MSTGDSQIVKYAVFPAIGIARVGNSPDEFFLAPEAPGEVPAPDGGFKDSQGRVKRQVARFRIYGLNAAGEAVREIVADEHCTITWEVHLANRKAVSYQFTNALDLGDLAISAELRNKDITGDARRGLIIDPGARTISGRNQEGPASRFDSGYFFERRVPLGELRTDDSGRLLVFGGLGNSASRDGSDPTTFANNDGWHDDTSDGPVRAVIRIGDDQFEAEPAMVAVTPPNYGQGLYGAVTMYDVVYDLFCRHSEWPLRAPRRPAFWVHIYPILKRMADSQWVNEGVHFLFGPGSPSDLEDAEVLAQLADPGDSAKPVRQELFEWFRDPDDPAPAPTELPPYYGDAFGDYRDVGGVGLAVTRTQFAWLRQWAEGDFDPAPPPPPPSTLEGYPVTDQPDALNRAHLEDILGGPFHPGIELTWTLRVASMWQAPFRLNVLPRGEEPRDDYGPILHPETALGPGGIVDASGPGTLTRWMGVPWQTDEASCMSGYQLGSYISVPSYWAARVPNQVLSERSYQRLQDTGLPLRQRQKHLDYRQRWLRFFSTQYARRIKSMVERWDRVGIVTPHDAPSDHEQLGLPPQMWVESEVNAAVLIGSDATFQQLLIAEKSVAPEPEVGLAASAAVRFAREAESVPPEERPQILQRDEM